MKSKNIPADIRAKTIKEAQKEINDIIYDGTSNITFDFSDLNDVTAGASAIGSGEIIKKGSAIINPGSVQIILSSPVRKHLEEKDDGKILNSIRATILENQQQAVAGKRG